jgi:hypothetical protein
MRTGLRRPYSEDIPLSSQSYNNADSRGMMVGGLKL